jgi:hypothetical protein
MQEYTFQLGKRMHIYSAALGIDIRNGLNLLKSINKLPSKIKGNTDEGVITFTIDALNSNEIDKLTNALNKQEISKHGNNLYEWKK